MISQLIFTVQNSCLDSLWKADVLTWLSFTYRVCQRAASHEVMLLAKQEHCFHTWKHLVLKVNEVSGRTKFGFSPLVPAIPWWNEFPRYALTKHFESCQSHTILWGCKGQDGIGRGFLFLIFTLMSDLTPLLLILTINCIFSKAHIVIVYSSVFCILSSVHIRIFQIFPFIWVPHYSMFC